MPPPIALIATVLGADVIICAVFAYLYYHGRQAHMGWWALAWLAGVTMQAAWLAEQIGVLSTALLQLHLILAVASQLMLLAGASRFVGRSLSPLWSVVGLLTALAAFVAVLGGVPNHVASMPVGAFAVLATLWGAVVFIVRAPRQEVGASVIGVALVLWGVHMVAYPVAAGLGAGLTAAAIASSWLKLGIAAGILVADFERGRREVAERETRYHDLFDNAVEGLFRANADGRIVNANPAFVELLGYGSEEEVRRLRLAADVFAEAGPSAELHRFCGPATRHSGLEMRWRRKDGSTLAVVVRGRQVKDATGAVLFCDGYVRDVSVEKRLQDQLIQSQKMEAIGRVTGGIAHDFNNLLTVILANTSDEGSADDIESRRQATIRAHEAALRAADLTQQLLTFSRRQVTEPRVIELGRLVQGLARLIKPLIGERVEIQVRTTNENVCARVDAVQMQQVVLNLAVNARDAMPEGGRLQLRVVRALRDAAAVLEHAGATPGWYAAIEVTDSGVGMTPEVRRHLFEPFFTTKEVGAGTGLGLSTVYGIVSKAGGHIEVDSTPGVGTRFCVYLPLADQAQAEDLAPLPVTPAGGRQTILVAEDEPLLQEVFRQVLEARGFRVLLAGNGDEAVRVCGREQGRIDLFVTDVVMPGTSGVVAARELRQLHPHLPILFVSGYTDRAEESTGALGPGEDFLGKPFSPQQLLAKVHEVLQRSGNTPRGAA